MLHLIGAIIMFIVSLYIALWLLGAGMAIIGAIVDGVGAFFAGIWSAYNAVLDYLDKKFATPERK